ncbi:protein FAM189B isoform X5 [Microtus ochrogaster]|uniref:Protein FAM189B isoform X5 n=1 Tax=Microtus ochrogaster TaxID=79684 RepID=A0ABM1AVW2_MICOH|nr:protein FAM189B isoform X5 [Microtus ochrogaster]
MGNRAAGMMPSPSDSSRSLTSRPSTRGLTHLRLHRPWLQALLTLGLAQVLLGILVVTFSMVASSVTTTESIKKSCPSWAGFSLAFSGLVGIVSWKRPFTLVISFFSLLSVLCVMLSMAGSVLSCKNAQLAQDFRECSTEGKVCVCCPPIPLHRPCPEWGQELKVAPNSTCDEARGALKNLLFSVCGLTICAAIICTLSAIVCCVQIFSLDLVHMATLFDPQLHDGSCVCERVASIVDVSMDSGSLVLSAIGDLPGGSSPSEDSCLLELQGSVRSVDYVLFRSIQRSRAGYCLSLDCGLRGPFEDSPLPRRPPRAARSYSCSAPEAPPPLGAPTAARSCHRLEGWPPWVGPCFPELRRRVPRGGSRSAAPPPARAPARRFSDSSGSLTPPGHRPSHRTPPLPLLLPRSHSDPGITTSSDTADFRDLYTKVLDEEAASLSSADTGLCSEACLFRLARCPSPKLLRARSAEKRHPVPTFQKVPLPSGPAPAHSLGDLKGSWPGRGLVTRFLQLSRKSPDPAGTAAHGHKQVRRSPWGRSGRESLHLRSCGDLSSGSSLRRLLSGRRLEHGARPHSLSLNGGSRETGL